MTITVENRIARVSGTPQLVCGNGSYSVDFQFDSEWDEYTDKTAQFRYIRDGTSVTDSVEFSGTSCTIPVLEDVDFVEIGVSAGTIRTTTPARIECCRCITDIPSTEYAAPRDLYNEIMDAMQEYTNPLPSLPQGYCFVVDIEGEYLVSSEGDYMIVKE